MADGDDHAGEVQQEILQPVDGLDVQVVGGLVQHDDVRVAEQGLGQQDLHLLPGVHVGHLLIMQLRADAKALQNPGSVGFRLPAAQLCEFRFQVGGPEAVRIGKVGLFVNGVLFLHHVVEVLIAHDDRVHDGEVVVGVLVLLQHGEALGGVDGDGAVGGFQFPGENAQERGFAGAVGADDAVAVAGQELQVHVLEKPLAAELHSEI